MQRLPAKPSSRSTAMTALEQTRTTDALPAYRSDFKLRERVTHPKFGNGIVTAIEADKLTIQFPRKVTKQIVDCYVKHRR